MKGLAVIVLRFTQPDVKRWKVPFNFRVGRVDVPIGLSLITMLLFLLAGINVLTKRTATISGVAFTVALFTALTFSERYYKRKEGARRHHQGVDMAEGVEEKFRLEVRDSLSPKSLQVRPGNVLVAVCDPDDVHHLEKVLEKTDPDQSDVVALSVNPRSPDSGEAGTEARQIVDDCEVRVFSKVVQAAEKAGKRVSLMAVPGQDPYGLILQAAQKLRSSRVVIGLSSKLSASEQEEEISEAWLLLPDPRPQILMEIVPDDDRAPLR